MMSSSLMIQHTKMQIHSTSLSMASQELHISQEQARSQTHPQRRFWQLVLHNRLKRGGSN